MLDILKFFDFGLLHLGMQRSIFGSIHPHY
ncbi:hypothetical protein C5167_001685 [Papaver somniferum]|uniref:Uncharacterized protein n=1 Tax=Papaver somniferum TaxID=3469 RepID=A0A4Y7KX24_PAPSO|nr:hypothetical protein C5167_001685 [Papaver somniferum]